MLIRINNRMRKEYFNNFASLLEAIMVTESSTAIDIMRRVPGAEALLKKIHGTRELAHDIKYTPEERISWSTVKGKGWDKKTKWILVKGEKGMGAIMAQGGTYYGMIADPNGEIQKKTSERGGDIIDFLKEYIGKPKMYYIGNAPDAHKEKIRARAMRKPIPQAQWSGEDNFVKLMMIKFKPLWLKAIDGAINDTKGWVQNMVKNHSFAKARHKLEKLQYLETIADKLRDGDNPLDGKERYNDPYTLLRTAIYNAVMMTAHHYYPDKSGGFRPREMTYSSIGKQHRLHDSDALESLFNAIRGGETDKISTMIGFFKRGLTAL